MRSRIWILGVLTGLPAALGQKDMRLASVAGRLPAFEVALSGETADHLGYGRRLDGKLRGEVTHRQAVVLGKGLQQAFLAGVESDPRQIAPRPCTISARRLRQSEGDRSAMVEAHAEAGNCQSCQSDDRNRTDF